jgi:hypothetical protein
MVRAWHGGGMASVNQTRPHCVNQMGKTHYKRLAARHGRGTVWARHGHGMLCVNRPLGFEVQPPLSSDMSSSNFQLWEYVKRNPLYSGTIRHEETIHQHIIHAWQNYCISCKKNTTRLLFECNLSIKPQNQSFPDILLSCFFFVLM